MRRSNSGNLHDRSSTTPRSSEGSRFSTWMSANGFSEPREPFGHWSLETTCSWIESLGLSVYNGEIRRFCKNGSNLLAMTYSDLDIKLGMFMVLMVLLLLCVMNHFLFTGIKNHLHRKKLFLALRAKNQEYNGPEKMLINLESNWVVSWLDDIGLPQYKERFLEAKIDIRVLNFITTEDLCHIKITNQLHHLSIKRGIQVLRKCNFDPGCLKRRLLQPEIPEQKKFQPEEVALWTNNR